MTKKSKTTVLITTILVLLTSVLFFILYKKHKEKDDDDLLPLELVTLKTTSGWGYKILVDHKVFIRQEFIPVITGFKSFKTEQQALATGNLVLQKIKKKQLPSITHADLQQLNIDTLP